jgi:hypothetical protein
LTLWQQSAICKRQKEKSDMYAAPEIIGTCLTCIAPSSFGATLGLILVGVLFGLHAERRKLAAVKARPTPTKSN